MGPGSSLVLTVLCAVLAGALLAALLGLAGSRRARRSLAAELAASRRELALVQRRLDELSARLEAPMARRDREYLITSAGPPPGHDLAVREPREPLTARQFASVAVGESLVTLFSFGYGVRRALSAENRNRIGFEMRREVKRSRKQRRREIKEARRSLRGAQRADLGEDAA